MTTNNEKTSKLKDCMGHTLNEGDWIDLLPPIGVKWIGRVTETHDGGIMLSIDKNQKGVTPAKIRIVFDITMAANPQMPVFPTLTKVPPPDSDEVIEKVMEIAKEPPPSPLQ